MRELVRLESHVTFDPDRANSYELTGTLLARLDITGILESKGWRVHRIWESSLRDEEALAAKVKLLL